MNPLAQRALLGIARAPSPSGTEVPPEIDALVSGAAPDQALLWAAGALAVYRSAGYAGRKIQSVYDACHDDAILHCTPDQTRLLTALWDDRELLPAACERLAGAGRVLAPELLPPALDLPPARRAAVERVLGPRGRWLAALRPRWTWALGGEEDADALAATVADGTERAARTAALAALRGRDPERARELVAASWKGEQADTRAALLAALAVGLGPGDEAFVAGCLRDRARAVRQQAQALLARLPESAYAARMAERAAALVVRHEVASEAARGSAFKRLRHLFGGEAPTAPELRLALAPPRTLPDDWRADGIAGTAPGAASNTPSAWACEVLAQVPPAVWLAPLDPAREPLAVVAQLPPDEPALALALAHAVATFGVGALARPLGRWLVATGPAARVGVDAAIARLTPLMAPLGDDEAVALLQRGEGLARIAYAQTLGLSAHPWCDAVGRALVGALLGWLAGGGRLDHPDEHPFLAQAIEDAPLALPEPLVAPLLQALEGALADPLLGAARQRLLERCTTRLRLRARLITEIPLE